MGNEQGNRSTDNFDTKFSSANLRTHKGWGLLLQEIIIDKFASIYLLQTDLDDSFFGIATYLLSLHQTPPLESDLVLCKSEPFCDPLTLGHF